MLDTDYIVWLNAIVVMLVIVSLYYSIRLMLMLNHIRNFGWWTWLPIIIGYALVNRFLILLVSLGSCPFLDTETLAALMPVYWLGMVIFVYGLYSTTARMKGEL